MNATDAEELEDETPVEELDPIEVLARKLLKLEEQIANEIEERVRLGRKVGQVEADRKRLETRVMSLERRAGINPDQRNCKRCGRMAQANAKTCPYCAEPL